MKYKGFTYTPAPKTAWDILSMLDYSMIQEAQRRGITVDDLVDQYTMQSTGEIFGHAPKPLRYMNYAYTPDQIKSFLKGLLSLSIPVALNTKNKDDQENNKFH